jgi:predicted 3-demethylubiquinone-9 3-methyltransferase (glyoxalase superfamily)
VKDVGSQATPEVIKTWEEVYRLFQECSGDRRERLQQVADRLGVSFKVARRRLRNYEAMRKGGARRP